MLSVNDRRAQGRPMAGAAAAAGRLSRAPARRGAAHCPSHPDPGTIELNELDKNRKVKITFLHSVGT